MPTTIYNRLNDREFVYSRNDLRKIAYWTHEQYVKETDTDPDKTEQDEEGRMFQVFEYPDEWIEKIDEITDWYFKKKRKIGDNHIKREEKAKAVKAERERRIAEGHFEKAMSPEALLKAKTQNSNRNQGAKPPYGNKSGNNQSRGQGGYQKSGGQGQGGYQKSGGQGQGGYQKSGGQGQGGYQKSGGQGQGGYQKSGGQGQGGYQKSGGQGQGGYQKSGGQGGYKKPGGYQNKPNYGSNRNYNEPDQNRSKTEDRSTFNSFNSDINSEFNYNKGFSAKYKSGPTPRASYYEAPSESKFTQKVEIDTNTSATGDGPKKRKRIAKALFVAAPSVNEDKETNTEN